MRTFAGVMLVGLLVGCGWQAPPQAGGRPVGHWVGGLADPDPGVRKKAATKLGNVGTADAAAVPALVRALRDPDARVRAEVALALLRVGPAAREAVPALTEVAGNDPDAQVRSTAEAALAKLRGGG